MSFFWFNRPAFTERVDRGEGSGGEFSCALAEPLPSYGLEDSWISCSSGVDRNAVGSRGDPVRPVFIGDRAADGERKEVRGPLALLRKSMGSGALPGKVEPENQHAETKPRGKAPVAHLHPLTFHRTQLRTHPPLQTQGARLATSRARRRGRPLLPFHAHRVAP